MSSQFKLDRISCFSPTGVVNNALYGSFLPVPSEETQNTLFPLSTKTLKPSDLAGAVVVRTNGTVPEKIKINEGRRRWKVKVVNEGDRPVQVNSYLSVLPLRC